MKIKLPVVLRSTYERETSELVKDIKVQESAKSAADKKVRNLKLKLERHDHLAELQEKDQSEEVERLKLELEKRDKQIKGMEWCIQERDKELDKVKAFNMDIYKKVELAGEMYRQFKDKVDKACEIEFVTRTITHEDIKKFMKVEDIIQLYTLIGIAGK
ncbi:hypothetical protein [Paraclostridium bifermentans]|uniref:hypothetical protein n=1 Tax=Paraclostridium bifermentans TaxID=1490 RepID=UPI0024BB5659|nr:hypothetical protein [Paraclostridium bifermentans]